MYPLLLAVQESCARIGAITSKDLAAVIKENYSKKLLTISGFGDILRYCYNASCYFCKLQKICKNS
jgi:hypothetical protein